MNSKFSTKLKTTATIILILLMASVTLLAIPAQPVQAQLAAQQPVSGPLPAGITVDNVVNTVAFISFRPNPVGLGQPILVNIWTSPSIHVERFQPGYRVTITKPDGTKNVVTVDSYCADSTAWFEYTADQVGTWKLKFDFLGTYYPAGRYLDGYIVTSTTSGSVLGSAYYMPSSTPEQTLTVQQDMVASWPATPLPTDYWTRPIPPEYRDWWSIAGNFPWFGPGGGPMWDTLYPNTNTYRMGISREPLARFAPWVQAPNSAHIVWKRQNDLGGLIGGDVGTQTIEGSSGYPTIILSGRAYQAVSKVSPTGPGSQTYWQCYDIRTGQLYWERPLYPGESEPTLIEYGYGNLAVPGEGAKPSTPLLLSISGGYLRKYIPWTGAMTFNRSTAPLTTAKYYMNGYALSMQNIGNATIPNYRLINWTTLGTTTNFTERVVGNITWPWSDLGNTQDFNAGIAVFAVRPESGNAFVGTELRAASMRTGAQLWNFTTDKIETSSGAVLVEGGKLAVGVLEDRQWLCWDVYTGKLLWKSEPTTYPWGDFWSYSSESAYGMIFSGTYEALYAFDWETGKIVWRFKAPANPYETPFTDETGQTVHAWHSSLYIADGKIFTYNSIHTPEQPITRGWKWYAINATTGEEVWSLPGTGVDARVFQGAIADGYLALANQYYGTMFVIGKGKSQTTVTAPDTAVAKGTPVLIKGTVLDKSPAQPGTPAVSKESMSTQMAYLNMQFPIAGFLGNETITGVPVTLTAVDPNGNVVDIGATTTNGYYGTFSYMWTPDLAGKYSVTATFMGDDSYGSSWAETAVGVTEAPAASPTATPITFDAINSTVLTSVIAGVVAIIIAIAIVGILMLRKRP